MKKILLLSFLICWVAGSVIGQWVQLGLQTHIYYMSGAKQYIPIDTNLWHYVVFTKASNNEGKIYFDGQLVHTGTFNDNHYNYSSLYLAASYYNSLYYTL